MGPPLGGLLVRYPLSAPQVFLPPRELTTATCSMAQCEAPLCAACAWGGGAEQSGAECQDPLGSLLSGSLTNLLDMSIRLKFDVYYSTSEIDVFFVTVHDDH